MITTYSEHMRERSMINQDDVFVLIKHFHSIGLILDDECREIVSTRFAERAIKLTTLILQAKILHRAALLKEVNTVDEKLSLLSDQITLNSAVAALSVIAVKENKVVLNRLCSLASL